ncbi:MAG: hypothetical protein DWQ07_23330 [Chloroflexi bacterium]|nr:MAG: hypothetical protein DWQ07_23330 [Chloroflexota bacterium]MBL1194083.1 hypothetical protein [Chloroflexota bacterium]NOH11377.1 hypothetical protein [Chloroflexota bacterium]
MIWISRIFRGLAMLLALFFVFAFPLTLVGRDIGQLVFDPEAVSEVVSENLAENPRFSLSILNQFTRFITSGEDADTDPVAQLVRLGLRSLTQDDIGELLNLTLPPELIADAFVQIVSGFYEWLDNDEPSPTIQLNVAPLKANFDINQRAVLETILNALPDCSAEQMLNYALSGDFGNLENLPVCKPPEPIYSEFLNLADILIPAWLATLPDTLDLGQQLQSPEQAGQLDQLKTNLLRTRSLLRWAWLPVLIVYIISIPMWARSWPSLFAWGWPLVLSGGISLLIALSLWLSTAGVPQLVVALFFENSLGGLFDSFRVILADLVTLIARPLALQSAFQLVPGILGVVVAIVLVYLRRRNASTSMPVSPTALE